MMEIIPAIDVKNGVCVRLRQGKENTSIVYGEDPLAIAEQWVSEGARRIHVVDLDGAFGRASGTLDLLSRMCRAVPAAIQFGGGLRTREAILAAFESGAAKAVLGTVAFENPDLLVECLREFGSGRIIVALDALDGRVATRGWQQLSPHSVETAAGALKSLGVREILYTDISRDGMMSGPDVDTLKMLADTDLAVIASGGIASLHDLELLLSLKSKPLAGAVIGKALYEQRLSLGAAIALTGIH